MMTEYEKKGWQSMQKAISDSPLLKQVIGVSEMTDRELLELAAKAAGIKNWWDGDCSVRSVGSTYWNPLEDDGDALRLAVKCGISDLSIAVGELVIHENCQLTGTDIVRRAIVRAAAEIGKKITLGETK